MMYKFLLCFVVILWVGIIPVGAQDAAISYDGLERTYALHVPENADEPMPLLIVLHRGAYSGEEMRAITGIDAIADREGFIVVYPDGIDGSWNDGLGLEFLTTVQQDTDDIGFLSSLIDHLTEDYAIDGQRIYVTGFSSGASMSYLLACHLADRIAGIAVTGALMMQHVVDDCAPSQPISMLLLQGTEDPVFAWDGGQFVLENVDYGYQLSAAETLDFWLTHNICESTRELVALPDADADDGTRVWYEAYSACVEGTSVEFIAVLGGGHNWAGVPTDLSRDVAGTVSFDVNASEIMWEFLSRQRLAE